MIIDVHTHIYPPETAAKILPKLEEFYGVRARWNATAHDLARAMEAAGVDRAVILPVPTRPDHVEANNRYSRELAAGDSRFIGFGGIHLSVPPDVLRTFRESGLRGVKIQPNAMGTRPDDRALFPFYRVAEEEGLVVLFHAGEEEGGVAGTYSRPAFFVPVLEEFPRLRCIFAHLGGYKRWDEARDLYAYPNAYFDTSYTLGILPDDEFVSIVSELEGRVVFGTDFPFRDPGEELSRLRALLGDDAPQAMGRTAARLLGLEQETA